MSLAQPYQVLRPSGPYAALDRYRAWRPSVLAGRGGRLRMWYGGHDGSTGRVLSAEQRTQGSWARLGVSVEPGLAGASDAATIDTPSVVRTPSGYLMAYVGSDGTEPRVHLALSAEGERWVPAGPFPSPEGRAATSTPCLVHAGDDLWLYYVGPGAGGVPTVFAARSGGGTAWQDMGPVLEPAAGEPSVAEPWVVGQDDDWLMLYVSRDEEGRSTIRVATSTDGRAWDRRERPLDLGRRHHDAGRIGGPSAFGRRDGRLRIWYSAADEGDTAGGGRLWSVDVVGSLP